MALTSLKPLKSCPGATGEGGRERGGSAGRAESAGGGLRGVYKGGGRGRGSYSERGPYVARRWIHREGLCICEVLITPLNLTLDNPHFKAL